MSAKKSSPKFVVACRGINRSERAKPGKRAQYRMIKPGEKLPIADFSPEELERKLASGALRYLKDKDPGVEEPELLTTTGKDHIVMDVGMSEVPDQN